ncbi:MAG: hypothetical protein ACXVHB_21905 [Solirubrobacteraceae bacterium]|jgi:hypothetical protein
MASPDTHPHRHTPAWAASNDVRLSFVVAACLLIEAVVAKEILHVSLDYFSQMAALWVFIAYLVTGRHDKSSARAFGLAAVAVTAAVLGLYAL